MGRKVLTEANIGGILKVVEDKNLDIDGMEVNEIIAL